MKTDNNLVKSPSPPLHRSHTGTQDHQAAFAAISAKTPVDKEFRANCELLTPILVSTLRRATGQLLIWSSVWATKRRI